MLGICGEAVHGGMQSSSWKEKEIDDRGAGRIHCQRAQIQGGVLGGV